MMSKARGTEQTRFPTRSRCAGLYRAFSRELGKVQADVTIHGPVYNRIDAINRKIDELGQWLTGEAGYFSRGYAGNTARPEVLPR